MEQIVVITVFAICAAICVNILSHAHSVAGTAVDTRHALMIAENAAESHKAHGGDLMGVSRTLNRAGYNDILGYDMLVIFFDNNWQVSDEPDAQFSLQILQTFDGSIVYGHITVNRISRVVSSDYETVWQDEMIRITTAARRQA